MKQKTADFQTMDFGDMLITKFTNITKYDVLCKESGISQKWDRFFIGILLIIMSLAAYWCFNRMDATKFKFLVQSTSEIITSEPNPQEANPQEANPQEANKPVAINPVVIDFVNEILIILIILGGLFILFILTFFAMIILTSFLFYIRMKKLGIREPILVLDWYASSRHVRTLWLRTLYIENIQNGFFTGNFKADVIKIAKILESRKNSIAIKRISKPETSVYGWTLMMGLGIALGGLIFENIIKGFESVVKGISICFVLLFVLINSQWLINGLLTRLNVKRISRKKTIDEICDNLNDLSWYLEMMQEEEEQKSKSKSYHYTYADSSAFKINLRY